MKSKPVEVAMLPLVAGDLATVALLVWMMVMMMMMMKIIIIAVIIIIMLQPDAVDAAVYDAGEGPGVEADDNADFGESEEDTGDGGDDDGNGWHCQYSSCSSHCAYRDCSAAAATPRRLLRAAAAAAALMIIHSVGCEGCIS